MNFLTTQLVLIHAGGPLVKIKSILLLTITFSPLHFLMEELTNWTTTNSLYVTFILGAIMIDHFLGSLVHLFKKSDFSMKKNVIGLLTKVGLVLAVGFCFEGINHIIEGDNIVKDYILIVLRLSVFLYPAGSALANSSILTNGKFPPRGFLEKLRKFQGTMKVEDITE